MKQSDIRDLCNMQILILMQMKHTEVGRIFLILLISDQMEAELNKLEKQLHKQEKLHQKHTQLSTVKHDIQKAKNEVLKEGKRHQRHGLKDLRGPIKKHGGGEFNWGSDKDVIDDAIVELHQED
jgi:hypothetical protein